MPRQEYKEEWWPKGAPGPLPETIDDYNDYVCNLYEGEGTSEGSISGCKTDPKCEWNKEHRRCFRKMNATERKEWEAAVKSGIEQQKNELHTVLDIQGPALRRRAEQKKKALSALHAPSVKLPRDTGQEFRENLAAKRARRGWFGGRKKGGSRIKRRKTKKNKRKTKKIKRKTKKNKRRKTIKKGGSDISEEQLKCELYELQGPCENYGGVDGCKWTPHPPEAGCNYSPPLMRD